MPRLVFIGLGSNLGDRSDFLKKAINALAPEVVLLQASSVYQTPPWGYTDQPPFLNQVIKAQTGLEPNALLKKLKKIEKELGRLENFHYGPRCIDLDILLYDDLICQSDSLTIPHPEMAKRAFVLVPLIEIAPDLVHPLLKVPAAKLLEKLDSSQITLFKGREEHETA